MESSTTTPRPGSPSAAAPREVHIRDLWAVVARRWRLIALMAVLVAGGAWFSGRGVLPRFQSRLTVQVSSSKQTFFPGSDVDIDEMALRTDPILSEALILTTTALAESVAAALDLSLEIENPAVYLGTVLASLRLHDELQLGSYELARREDGWELRHAGGPPIATGAWGEAAEGPGFSFTPLQAPGDGDVVPFRIVSLQLAAAWVRAGLSYRVIPETNALEVTFTGYDPTLVPLVLNRAALELRADGARRAGVAASRRREYVEEQLARATVQLQGKLTEVQRFKETEQITDLTTEEQAVVQRIATLEHERQEIQVRLSSLREAVLGTDSVSVQALNRLAAVEGFQANSALSFQIGRVLQLYEDRRELTAGALGLQENNPQVQGVDQRIRESYGALRSAVQAAILSLEGRDQAIDANVGRLREGLAAFPGMETRIAQMQLEASILEETNRYLLGQYQQARMQEATIAPYVTILDGASPAFRLGTNLQQKVVLGFLVGLLLGIAGAFFLEYLDRTIKDASDVERSIGTPVLGRIPLESKLATSDNGHRGGVVILNSLGADDPAVEAYRALRTNVTFVGAERPLQVIAVTSPGPSEGKTTTAANLAITLSQGGSRTLLIDGDLRRPQLHHAFRLVETPGLTDVLVGRALTREAVRPGVSPFLDVLPAGPTPPNPSELLGSEAMRKLLGDLRREYEYVVIDTPPSLPVTDATVVAAASDATILVIKSGETEEDAAQRAVEQLQRVRARIAGAVLNGVAADHDRYYSYYSSRPAPYRRRGRSKLQTLGAKLTSL